MATASTELAKKMLARAARDRLPAEHPLRVLALEFEAAVMDEVGTMAFLGSWARARKAWCAYTGEPLVS